MAFSLVKFGTRIKRLNPIKNMRSRIISSYAVLCAGARNIIDKRINTDTVLGFIRDYLLSTIFILKCRFNICVTTKPGLH